MVKLFLGNGIELVIMANGAPHGQTHPDGRGGAGSVDGIADIVFFIYGSAFTGSDIAAIEAGGDTLIQRGFRQQITSQLFNGKLVKRHVLIKCLYHPVTVGPDFTVVIQM